VVEVAEGRAFSADGVAWKVELLSREPVRLPPWGDMGPAARERRYFTFGVWQAGAGLRRAPLNAILGDQSGHPALAELREALEAMPEPPFALADHLELWLLDAAAGRPLALLRSLVAEAAPPVPRGALVWRGFRPDDPGDRPPAHLLPADGRGPALVEGLVAEAAGGEGRVARWYRRDPEGGGRPVLTVGEARHAPEPLPAEAFPPLLLREAWEDAEARARVEAFLAWTAPMLLTLPGLDRERRAWLEARAVARAELLYRYRKLLPEVVDRRRIESALVQAVIQRTSA
jgi:hypothetical protein